MASDFKIFWTEEAILNLEDILDYLVYLFNNKQNIDKIK